MKSTSHCSLSEKSTTLQLDANFSTGKHLKTLPEDIEIFEYIILEIFG